MWRSAGYGVDESLQGLLVHMVLLQRGTLFRHTVIKLPEHQYLLGMVQCMIEIHAPVPHP